MTVNDYIIKVRDAVLDFPFHNSGVTTIKKQLISLFRSEKKNWFRALNGIDLELKQGEVVGILGPNGAGKSTLLRLVGGIYKPDRGIVDTKGRITLLAGYGLGFSPGLSGRENIHFSGGLLGMTTKELEEMEEEIAKLKEQLESKDKEILVLRKALDVRIRASTGSSFPDLHAALAPSIEATVDFEKRYSEDPRYKIRRKRSKKRVIPEETSKSNPTTEAPKPPSRPRNLPIKLNEEEESREDYVERVREFLSLKKLSSSLTNILVRLTEFRGTLDAMQTTSQYLSDAMKCDDELSPNLKRKIAPMYRYLRWFRSCLGELNTAQNILNVSLLHGLEKPLREFLTGKMIPLSQLRCDLDRIRSGYINASSKFLGTRKKDKEKIKTRVSTTIKARRIYEMKRLDASITIEQVLEHLNGNLSENFLSALYALLVYFGHCVSHTDSYHENVKRGLDNLSESLTNDAKLKRAKRDAERRTSLENKFRVDDTSSFALSPHILHTKDFTGGNLFCKIIHSRKSIGNMMKDWTLRWFSISPTNKLCVQLIDMKVNTQIIVELADLTISTVKIPSSESSYGDDSRMFRFDVISADPTNGKLLLQTGSSKERDVWIQRLRKSIAASLRTRSTSMSMSDRLHRKLLEISPRCADCGATNPTWLSLNLGVSVCIVRRRSFSR